MISVMLQAVVAAYQVYGLNSAICAGVSGVMPPWRGSRAEDAGMAWVRVDTETRATRRASQELEAMVFERTGLLRLAIVESL